MARSHAFLKVTVWTDPDFTSLTGAAQRLYMLILSQGDLNACGVVQANPRRWARMAADTTADDIDKALGELEEAGKVVVDHDTDECWVRGFIKHEAVLQKPNMVKALASAWQTVLSPMLRDRVKAQLPDPIAGAIPDAIKRMSPRQIGDLLREALGESGPRPPDPPTTPSRKGSTNPSRKGSKAAPVKPVENPSPNPSGNPTSKGAGSGYGSGSGCSPVVLGCTSSETEEDERPPIDPEQRYNQALDHMAAMDLHWHREAGGTIRTETGFLTEARRRIEAEHEARLRAELDQQPNLPVDEITELIDPRYGPADGGTARAQRADVVMAQRRAEHERAVAEKAPPPSDLRDALGGHR